MGSGSLECGVAETMRIEITNLKPAQRMAIEDMLATWARLGGLGASRWTAFYADGDGDFRPRVTVNGQPAVQCVLITEEERWPNGSGGEYRIDYDRIAWRLREDAGPRWGGAAVVNLRDPQHG